MLVIDTKMTPPNAEAFSREALAGNELWHVPALQYRPTGIPLELSDFDAAFLGSPRAVNLSKEVLKNFCGVIFAAGVQTAQCLLQSGISVSVAGLLKKASCKKSRLDFRLADGCGFARDFRRKSD